MWQTIDGWGRIYEPKTTVTDWEGGPRHHHRVRTNWTAGAEVLPGDQRRREDFVPFVRRRVLQLGRRGFLRMGAGYRSECRIRRIRVCGCARESSLSRRHVVRGALRLSKRKRVITALVQAP